MTKLVLSVELEYDEELMHSGDRDPGALSWFMADILGGELVLHSCEIGDEVGMVKVLEIFLDERSAS